MPDPASDLQSKICRAIKALLISEGAGSEEDTYCEFSTADRTVPNTTIESGQAMEHVKFTGNWHFPGVIVSLRDPAMLQPEETNRNLAWKNATDRYNRVRIALSRIGPNGEFSFLPGELTNIGRGLATAVDSSADAIQFAEDNADMADFTVFWWQIVGLNAPRVDATGNYFDSELRFDCIACNGNFS